MAGSASADIAAAIRIAASTSSPPLELGLADLFGSSVVFVGDVDGDQIVDLAVGAPYDDTGGTDRGAVWLLFLRADGSVRDARRLSSLTPALSGEIGDWDLFGSSVAALGDIDADGVPDMAVGAARADWGGVDRGAVWILELFATGDVKSVRRIDGSDLAAGAGLDDGDRFGQALVAVGDLDGDGASDLAVTAPGDDDGVFNAGAVWMLRLAMGDAPIAATKLANGSGGLGAVLASGDMEYAGVAAPGDLDGNGVPDLVIGTGGADRGAVNTGSVHILHLDATGTALAHSEIGLPAGDLGVQDRFGHAVAAGADLDGDGIGDLVVGATGDDDGGGEAGALWVAFLDQTGAIRGRRKISATRGGLVQPPVSGDKLGAGLAMVAGPQGVVLAAGATGADDGALNAGEVRVLTLDQVWTLATSTTLPATTTTVLQFPSTSSTLIPTSSTSTSTLPSPTTTSTTTIPPPPPMCGDATGDGSITATDALSTLRTAVGLATCALCVCDTDASGLITVVDALHVLAVSTAAQTADLACTPCL